MGGPPFDSFKVGPPFPMKGVCNLVYPLAMVCFCMAFAFFVTFWKFAELLARSQILSSACSRN